MEGSEVWLHNSFLDRETLSIKATVARNFLPINCMHMMCCIIVINNRPSRYLT